MVGRVARFWKSEGSQCINVSSLVVMPTSLKNFTPMAWVHLDSSMQPTSSTHACGPKSGMEWSKSSLHSALARYKNRWSSVMHESSPAKHEKTMDACHAMLMIDDVLIPCRGAPIYPTHATAQLAQWLSTNIACSYVCATQSSRGVSFFSKYQWQCIEHTSASVENLCMHGYVFKIMLHSSKFSMGEATKNFDLAMT